MEQGGIGIPIPKPAYPEMATCNCTLKKGQCFFLGWVGEGGAWVGGGGEETTMLISASLVGCATMSQWVINHKYPGEFLGVMNDFPCHPQLIVNMTNFLLLPALQSFGHGPDFSCQIIEGASSCRSGIP